MGLRTWTLGVLAGGAAALLGGGVPLAPVAPPSITRDVLREPLPAIDRIRSRAAPAEQSVWALRTNGWYIQVDGADIDLPTVAEETNAAVSSDSTAGPDRSYSISPFDHLIVYHARSEGLDWRLVAALIFEESRFDPNSRSSKGALGLMQVRPIAADAVGETKFQAPEDNIRAGVRYLGQLEELFADATGRDRLAMVLAAYNAGPGHLRDAQVVARRLGFNPNRWFAHLDVVLPLLEEERVYRDLPNGFAKGRETVSYVQRILDRFKRYQIESVEAGLPSAAASGRTNRPG